MPSLPVADTKRRWRVTPLHVGMGYFDEWSSTDKFGKNTDVGTAYEDVWAGGGTMTLLTTASTMIVTSSGVDTAGSTGALTVTLEGLDSGYNVISETVTLVAATPPTTNASFIRVYRAYVATAGTGLVNANDIVVTATTGGSEQIHITADTGQSHHMIYTVPFGHTAYLDGSFLATDTTASRTITGQIQVKTFGGAWQVKHTTIIGTGLELVSMDGSGAIPAKSDIKWRAKASTGTTNVVSAGIKILLFKD